MNKTPRLEVGSMRKPILISQTFPKVAKVAFLEIWLVSFSKNIKNLLCSEVFNNLYFVYYS